jgi:phosphoenolpyruvate carboxykinase (ATP)
VGTRMKLKYTRAMINAALNGDLGLYTYDKYHIHSVFGVAQPRECPGVPSSVLSPRTTWNNDEAYYTTAFKLTNAFRENFKKFEAHCSEEIRRGGPQRYAF